MPALSWNEIRNRAVQFSHDWEGETSERAEAQTFWNEFFQVFGIKRRTIAAFEEPVKSIKETYHFIDLFWKGRLLAEHKSATESLDKAKSQAFQYIQDLATSNRLDEIPRYIVLSNFQNFALYDIEPDSQFDLPLWKGRKYDLVEFPLSDLHRHVKRFGFIIGQKTHQFGEEDPANLKAAQLMADLHDALKEAGYEVSSLERLLVRVLFCLFSDDTGIFETAQFELFVENRTREDGSDLGPQLNALFELLDTPVERRPKHLDEDLASFPFVDGRLFEERLPLAGFNRDMRDRLQAACRFDWSRISPAIFGSLFQGIMDAKERRQIGGHYTSERDILRLIRPLFLDDLRSELELITADRSTRRASRLAEFRKKLRSLTFLDPACGCGNFLVVAYRELRLLELDALKATYDFENLKDLLKLGEVAKLSIVDVDQFYGIELGEWPAKIAETALWLTDHQMNTQLSLTTGNFFQRIPLRTSPHIRCANALRIRWEDLLPAGRCSYVLGNPPFVGKQFQNAEQKADMSIFTSRIKGAGVLDYVTCWYFKAVEYISDYLITCAFVSTNSITQGEQVGILWGKLQKLGIHINFAHRTFAWRSEARGAAHVHVVIIGFSKSKRTSSRLFVYKNIKGDPEEMSVNCINPYLVDAPFVLVNKRREPICSVHEMNFGNMPNEGGHLLLAYEEQKEILTSEPHLERYIHHIVGSREFINGLERFCFWLADAPAEVLRTSPELKKRLEKVKQARQGSKRAATRALAETPALFGEIRQSSTRYVAVPRVSSERRIHIPIGFLPPEVISTDLLYQVPDASVFEYGVVQSAMHMAWVRTVAGRLKSDIRYSAQLVYNNFPWPVDVTPRDVSRVEEAAQDVLQAREPGLSSGSSLADLYDPLCMPESLLKAHHALDRAVDRCYRGKGFSGDLERVGFLFRIYEELTSPLARASPRKARRKTGRRRKKEAGA